MPVNNVDLTAVLPVLQEAAKPFILAIEVLDRTPTTARPNDMTRIRNYVPIGDARLGDMRRLVQAIEAVYRMAGVK